MKEKTSPSETKESKSSNARINKNEAIERVRRYLKTHFAEKITLDFLARYAGLNKSRLVRRFHRQIGFPPHDYLNRVRIEEAKELLKAGFPVIRTALKIGFCDQSHLTRQFKKIVGMTPTEYVEKSKNVQDKSPSSF